MNKQHVENKKRKFNTAYDHPLDDGIEFTDPSLTKQSEAKDADINTILARVDQGNLHEYRSLVGARFEDLTTMEDYQSSLNKVIEAQQLFAALPANIRNRFANDPAQFLGFATNPKNVDEMVKLGIASEYDMRDRRQATSKDFNDLTESIRESVRVVKKETGPARQDQ